jgi:hypothetical protein
MSLLINGLVFIDAYLCLVNPFHPREKRTNKIYLPIMIFASILLGIDILRKDSLLREISLDLYFYPLSDTSIKEKISAVVFVLIPVIPSILVLNRFRKKGTSTDLRKFLLRRQLFYMISYALYTFIKVKLLIDKKFTLEICTSKVYLNLGYFLLFISRISEPYVWNNLVEDCKKVFRCMVCSKHMSIKRFKDQPLNAFANSIMNIEYVQLILTGICNFMEI